MLFTENAYISLSSAIHLVNILIMKYFTKGGGETIHSQYLVSSFPSLLEVTAHQLSIGGQQCMKVVYYGDRVDSMVYLTVIGTYKTVSDTSKSTKNATGLFFLLQ